MTGTLSSTSRWDDVPTAVALAEPYGVRVHLCVTNFDPDSLSVLLGSETARATLIDQLQSWVANTGAHGVNIDFEGVPSSRKQHMVDFVADLQAAIPEVVLATPAVDWSGAWDYSELSRYADLFIMGYGYHWGGSSYAGPNDPLFGGDPWGSYSLDWTVTDYLDNGADPERVILGLPLYGLTWPVSSGAAPAPATGYGSAIFWAEAQEQAAVHGRNWDDVTSTPWWYDGAEQGWYGDIDSLRERVQYVVDGRDRRPWASGRSTTTTTTRLCGTWYATRPRSSGTRIRKTRAATSPPRPALPSWPTPGDTIILSGRGSTGPEGVQLQFAWTQVEGPPVSLDAAGSMEPSFTMPTRRARICSSWWWAMAPTPALRTPAT